MDQELKLTVYVQGLPYTSSEQEILEHFKDCGEIQYHSY